MGRPWVNTNHHYPAPGESRAVLRELAWLYDTRPLPETWSAIALEAARALYREPGAILDFLAVFSTPEFHHAIRYSADHALEKAQKAFDP
jgi:hypothetical protein